MGKKKDEIEVPTGPKHSDTIVPQKHAEEWEDSPLVKDLKAVDDKYLALEKQYEKEVQELQKKYMQLQAPLLEERKTRLMTQTGASAEDLKLGTPACKGFWLMAMANLPAFEDSIQEWDAPVLEYLCDITKGYIDSDDLSKGFRINFHFVENPYFSNAILWKEYHTEESSPYTCEMDTTEIKASEINWKPGKNVTIETIKKKVKGGGAKKNKQKGKEKEEFRDSFFRNFFKNLKPGMPIPEDIDTEEARQMCDGDDDDDTLMEILMETDLEMGCALRDMLIPYAVRWYTGEAAPDHDDESDEEEGLEEDSEEDDEDDNAGHKSKGKKQEPGKKADALADEGQNKKTEECKQQ